jgi:hypothetical protein
MIVSNKHGLIFVKTKKTAGSTLEKLLFPYLGKMDVCTGSPRDNTPRLNTDSTEGHMGWKKINTMYSGEWNNFFKFTIERNPWDKVVSSYFWHKEIKPERFSDMEFEEYVMTCPMLPRDWYNYAAPNNTIMVDSVYKYEEMDKVMYPDLNARFGFNISTKDVKGTKLKSGIRKVSDYRDMHTKKTIERVKTLFKNEIDMLGYTFE